MTEKSMLDEIERRLIELQKIVCPLCKEGHPYLWEEYGLDSWDHALPGGKGVCEALEIVKLRQHANDVQHHLTKHPDSMVVWTRGEEV